MISPKIFFMIILLDWFFLDWVPVFLALCYNKNKFAVRVFRIRGFYVGPGLLQNYMNKEILDMEKATNE